MKDTKKKVIDTITDYAGPAIGATAGAGIGLVLAGPAGAAIGSIAGTAIEKTVARVGKEIKERCLSNSENRKIGSVYENSLIKIDSNFKAGMLLRTDDFFDADTDDRSSAEEVLEATLFAAQRESEEKKLPYLANLYANIIFDETASRPMANQLIKIASEISYRQIVILSVIGRYNYGMMQIPLRSQVFRGFDDYSDMSIAAEIFDLYRMSLLISRTAILDAASFTPSLLVMNGMGELLFRYMELQSASADEVEQEIIVFLTNNSECNMESDVVTAQLPKDQIEAILAEHTVSNEEYEAMISEVWDKMRDAGELKVTATFG